MSMLSPQEIELARENLLEKEKEFFQGFFGSLCSTSVFGPKYEKGILIPFDVFYTKWNNLYFFVKLYDLNQNLNVEICFTSIDALCNKIKKVI